LLSQAFLVLDASEFRKVVSGRRRGITAALWRGAFSVAEVPYRLGVGWRNRQYDRGTRAIQHVPAPVISVGNITTGGTGKTPLVAWLAKWFRQRDVRVSLISRGYKAEAGAQNDEALELEQKLPDVPHLQNPDRVAAARVAIEEFDAQLILLDDAFQHRRIHRDLDIVLIDALEPFGYGRLLPRGLLREPLANLKRADLLVLSRADAVDDMRRRLIRSEVARHAGELPWVEVIHEPAQLVRSSGPSLGLDQLRGERVAAFCGIGNPQGFQHSLRTCGIECVGFREFADHHGYDASDVAALAQWGSDLRATALVCTCKDLVKIQADALGDVPLWALEIGMAIRAGQDVLNQQLNLIYEKVAEAAQS